MKDEHIVVRVGADTGDRAQHLALGEDRPTVDDVIAARRQGGGTRGPRGRRRTGRDQASAGYNDEEPENAAHHVRSMG
jgi:hypothetical protein